MRPLKDRKVVNIDRDNFNDVLAKAAPRVAMKVENKLTGDDTKLAVELNFKQIDDFEPARVAEQVGPLRELLEMRQQLTQLMSKMEGNDKLDSCWRRAEQHRQGQGAGRAAGHRARTRNLDPCGPSAEQAS